MSLLALPFVGLPARGRMAVGVASMLIHLFYFAALIESYRTGDMGQVYPIARGAAPLMTATASPPCSRREARPCRLARHRAACVAGVLLLSLRGGRDLAKLDRRAVGFALFTAVTICAYSVVDGIGARLAGIAQCLYGCCCSSASGR